MNGYVATAIGCCGLLLWAWIGYPLVILALERIWPHSRPSRAVASLRSVTVIVATRDDSESVASRVADVLAADYGDGPLDAVVAVDASVSDATRSGLDRLAGNRVTVVSGDAPGGKASALNAGMRVATGDVIVFTDVQQRFEPDTIRLLVDALRADARVRIVGGALQLPGDAPGAQRTPVEWYWAMERRLRAGEARIHSTIGVSGSIYAMHREAWAPLPASLILDDVYVPMRAVLRGERVGYVLDARAWDVRRTDAVQEGQRKVRTLTGNFQLVAWLPALLLPTRNPVWLQFVSHKLLRLATPWLLLVGGAAAGIALASTMAAETLIMGLVTSLVVSMLALAVPPFARRTRSLVRWAWSANEALVRASFNGVRGHWNVWN